MPMAENDYHFIDRWRVVGNLNEVADIIEDAELLPRRAHTADDWLAFRQPKDAHSSCALYNVRRPKPEEQPT